MLNNFEVGDVFIVDHESDFPSEIESLPAGAMVVDPDIRVRTILNDVFIFFDHGPYPAGRYTLVFLPKEEEIDEVLAEYTEIVDSIYESADSHYDALANIAKWALSLSETSDVVAVDGDDIIDSDGDVWYFEDGLYRMSLHNAATASFKDVVDNFGPVTRA